MTYQALKTRSIRERLGLRQVGGVVMTAAEASGRKPAAEKPRTMAGGTPRRATSATTGYEVQRAELIGRSAERRRWETVMLDPATKGKERIAAAMLCATDDNAATIMVKLGNVRTDAERQHANQVDRQARANAVWDRVIAGTFRTGAAK